jgi:uncharacterized membrane protein YhhN
MYLLYVLIILASFAALASAFGRARGSILYPLTKPVPLIVIIAALLLSLSQHQGKEIFFFLMIAGFVFGLLGDIILIQERRFFFPGLVSFLLGHILYVAAFSTGSDHIQYFAVCAAIPFCIFFFIFSRRMDAKAKKDHFPAVIVYFIVIILMCVSAFSFDSTRGAVIPVFGIASLLFCISDALLAWTLFVKETPLSHATVLVTYFAAQIVTGFQVVMMLRG